MVEEALKDLGLPPLSAYDPILNKTDHDIAALGAEEELKASLQWQEERRELAGRIYQADVAARAGQSQTGHSALIQLLEESRRQANLQTTALLTALGAIVDKLGAPAPASPVPASDREMLARLNDLEAKCKEFEEQAKKPSRERYQCSKCQAMFEAPADAEIGTDDHGRPLCESCLPRGPFHYRCETCNAIFHVPQKIKYAAAVLCENCRASSVPVRSCECGKLYTPASPAQDRCFTCLACSVCGEEGKRGEFVCNACEKRGIPVCLYCARRAPAGGGICKVCDAAYKKMNATSFKESPDQMGALNIDGSQDLGQGPAGAVSNVWMGQGRIIVN